MNNDNNVSNEITILVVDDNEDIRTYARFALEREGYRVIEAADGQECLDHVQSHRVDLILTDMVMPHKEGLETIGDVTKRPGGPRVIGMSGAPNSASYLNIARKMGAQEIIEKPFSREQLVSVVNKVYHRTTDT